MRRSDTLRRDVAALCAHGDRAVGAPGHDAAHHHLVRRFGELGLRPYAGGSFELPYEVRRQRFTNVVGVAPGADAAQAPVLIGAHYDTVQGTPGADDNAAAVAIALEVARRLVERPAERSVVIAHFDAEEPPYFHTSAMGSTRFVADGMLEPVHAAIVMDLVGHAIELPGLEDALGVMGGESHPLLAATVAAHASASGSLLTLPNRVMPDMSDHYAFRIAGRPYLFLTCGQWRHYHRPTDTPERLDFGKMARIADLLEALVREAAELALDGAVEHDTLDVDTANLQRLLGPRAAAVGLDGPWAFERVVRGLVGALLDAP